MHQVSLPVPPHIIARVVELAANPDSTVSQLSALIKMDAVLSTQVLKSVNSSYYSLRNKMSSVERAISFMGIRAVRNLVLCLGVRGLAPQHSKYPIEFFWESSLRRAVAAKCLARRLRIPNEDELFTMGLCQDMGVLLLVREGTPEQIDAQLNVVREIAQVRLEQEQHFGKQHTELGAALFESWKFAADVSEPVRWHHDPENAPPEHATRANIAFAAEAIADLLAVEDKPTALRVAGDQLLGLHIEATELQSILDEVSASVVEAAEMLEIQVGHQASYQEIADQASRGLMALNFSYQSLTDQLQASLEQQQQMAAKLEVLNRELELRSLTDQLTSLPNRRAFDDGLVRELERARRLNLPLSLLMLDVDHFKKFNDTYGHQMGDRVLQEVSGVIARNIRSCDLGARYGGEEFAVILPHTEGAGALVAAERIRNAVDLLRVQQGEQPLRVTISIGVATTVNTGDNRVATMLIRKADDALYLAKEAGRNCVRSAPQ